MSEEAPDNVLALPRRTAPLESNQSPCELCGSPVRYVVLNGSGVLCSDHEKEWHASAEYDQWDAMADAACFKALEDFLARKRA